MARSGGRGQGVGFVEFFSPAVLPLEGPFLTLLGWIPYEGVGLVTTKPRPPSNRLIQKDQVRCGW